MKMETIRQNETEEQRLERLERNYRVSVYVFVIIFIMVGISTTLWG